MTDKKSLWNEAGRSGLVLGGVSVLYLLITTLLSKIGAPVIVSIASTAIWIFKIWLCIWLMKVFMTKYASRYPEADNSDTFRFGTVTALLSALIYAAFYLLYVLYIQPDIFSEAMDTMMENYESLLDANSMDMMESLMSKMPTISFFSQLFYCWIVGTVISAILSRNIPSRNPFSDKDIKDE